VCRKYYVHPAIIEAYLDGFVLPPATGDEHSLPRDGSRLGGLRRDEIAVLELLRGRSSHQTRIQTRSHKRAETRPGTRRRR